MPLRTVFVALIALYCVSACTPALLLLPPSFGGPAISGRVVDEHTHRAVEGAIVAVYWKGVVPIKGSHACIHVETATTASDGTFQTAPWSFPKPVVYGEHDMDYEVYKPGMTLDRYSIVGLTLELTNFSGDREARLKELQRLSRTVRCSNPSVGIADLKDAIATEMASLVTSKDEARIYVDEARALSRFEREGAAAYARWVAEGAKD